jgi:hypothetical protein
MWVFKVVIRFRVFNSMFLFDGGDTKRIKEQMCVIVLIITFIFIVYGLGFELSYKLDLQGTMLYLTIVNSSVL